MSTPSPQLIPLDAPTLVQASAGTGKTYTITTYFVRAILERDLRPEQILVVTYTKAATAELRVRARERIITAITLLDRTSDDGDLLRRVVDETVARLGRRATEARLRSALGQMDRASIFTIHGFCQRLLQEHPLLFGIDFDFEVADDSASMYSELAVDFWGSALYDAPDWLLRALQERSVNAPYLAKLASVALMPGVEILGPAPCDVGDHDLIRWMQCAREATELWRTRRKDIAEILLTDEGLNRTRYPAATIGKTWLPALDDFFAKTRFRFPPDFLAKLAQGDMTTKKGFEEPKHPFFEACARLWRAHQTLLPGFDHAVFVFQERFLQFARAQARRRREDKAVFTYDDLLALVYAPFDSSRPPGVSFDPDLIVKTISAAYPLALVDEFQDTDAVQYGILRAIYGKSSAIYVGDPKQAIYAFRGADIFSYMGAVRDVGDRVHTLKTNRRSDPGVVRAVNTIFSLRKRPFILEGIDMEEAIPHHEDRRSTLDPSMEVVFLDESHLRGPITTGVAPVVANEIALLLGSNAEIENRPVGPGDVAVLCRSNDQAFAMTDALRALNVPVSLDGGASVLSTGVASDLSAVLEAALTPGDSSLVRRAVLTSLLGVSPSELSCMTDAVWSGWVSRFRVWNETWHGQGVVRFLEDMLRSTDGEATIARHPAARRMLTDLLHIEELLLHGERERRRDPIALMQWFRRLKDGGPDIGIGAREELQQRLDAESGAVRVSTIHKSKGLEYGIVYCPFTWNGRVTEVAVKFHDEHRRLKVDLGSNELAAHKQISEQEAVSEALRLLYVAVTRAKYRCTLFWGRASNWKKSALCYLLHGWEGLDKLDQDGMWRDVEAFAAASAGTVACRPAHSAQAATREHAAPRRALVAREQTRFFNHAPRIASFTSLTGHDEKTPSSRGAAVLTDSKSALFADLPGGARTGRLLHSILELADFQKLDTDATKQLVERQLRGFGFDAALAPVVQRDLLRVGATPLSTDADAPRLIDLSRDLQLRELGFMLCVDRPKLEGLAELMRQYGAAAISPRYYERLAEVSSQTLQRFLQGYIDLMFEWQGKWYVADYKSNTLPKYEPEAINDAVQREHYVLQGQIYTAAAHRYLQQRVRDYEPEAHWGGVIFLFLRGMQGPERAGSSVYFDRQPAELLRAVDRWLGGGHESR
jgi:exodeoxyribonuclease V beta subunit